MTTTTSATVETVTAEVRVLMVGSRQVTMSVYNQLDRVDPGDVEPFGRVAPRDANQQRIYIVGRERSSGALVRSSTVTSGFDMVAWNRTGALYSDADSPLARQYAERLERDLQQYAEQWRALPLIVLAGLR